MSDIGNDVPGAGVNPDKVINPTKRIKKLWRTNGQPGSLKEFARSHLASDNQKNVGLIYLSRYAEQFFYNKSSEHDREQRKERKSRVRAAQAKARSTRPAGGNKPKKGKGKGKKKSKSNEDK